MQTMLVNPHRNKKGQFTKGSGKRRKSGARVSIVKVVKHPVVVRANAGKRRRGSAVVVRLANPAMANPRRRRRAANMMILPNRRHRRRANPAFSLSGALRTMATGGIAAGGSYLVNKFAVSKLSASDETAGGAPSVKGLAMRGALRLGLGALAAGFFPGAIGAAANGAMLYPLFSEIDQYIASQGSAAPTGADLHGLDADLNDVLDDY